MDVDVICYSQTSGNVNATRTFTFGSIFPFSSHFIIELTSPPIYLADLSILSNISSFKAKLKSH